MSVDRSIAKTEAWVEESFVKLEDNVYYSLITVGAVSCNQHTHTLKKKDERRKLLVFFSLISL